MAPTISSSTFRPLRLPGNLLAEARLQCHHAVQLNTRLARGFVTTREDDSHTSLGWDATNRALIGQSAGPFRLGLRIADLELILLSESGAQINTFALDGQTIADGSAWLGSHLSAAGLDRAPLSNPIHFELEDHPLAHGARFRLRGREDLFEELARWYGNAAECLLGLAAPVRCWPHHFDIAAQMPHRDRTIGIGMSPGDAGHAQPYFYVNVWPHADVNLRPKLAIGNWHTDGWTGALLTAEDIREDRTQQQTVEEFLSSTIAVIRSM